VLQTPQETPHSLLNRKLKSFNTPPKFNNDIGGAGVNKLGSMLVNTKFDNLDTPKKAAVLFQTPVSLKKDGKIFTPGSLSANEPKSDTIPLLSNNLFNLTKDDTKDKKGSNFGLLLPLPSNIGKGRRRLKKTKQISSNHRINLDFFRNINQDFQFEQDLVEEKQLQQASFPLSDSSRQFLIKSHNISKELFSPKIVDEQNQQLEQKEQDADDVDDDGDDDDGDDDDGDDDEDDYKPDEPVYDDDNDEYKPYVHHKKQKFIPVEFKPQNKQEYQPVDQKLYPQYKQEYQSVKQKSYPQYNFNEESIFNPKQPSSNNLATFNLIQDSSINYQQTPFYVPQNSLINANNIPINYQNDQVSYTNVPVNYANDPVNYQNDQINYVNGPINYQNNYVQNDYSQASTINYAPNSSINYSSYYSSQNSDFAFPYNIPQTPGKQVITQNLVNDWHQEEPKYEKANYNAIKSTQVKLTNPFIYNKENNHGTIKTTNSNVNPINYATHMEKVNNKTGERVVEKLSKKQQAIKPKKLDFSSFK
jgi:hypothetical protein